MPVNFRLGTLNPPQYSSGSNIQVDERSACVITQILPPVIPRVYTDIVAIGTPFAKNKSQLRRFAVGIQEDTRQPTVQN
jgi:hypothetical protein